MLDRRRTGLPVRRNRVEEPVALAIAAAAGAFGLLADAHPTGTPGVDAVIAGLAVAVVAWASASAPWWAVTGACGIGAAVAGEVAGTLAGALGFVAGLVIGLRRTEQSALRAVLGGIAANVLIRSDLEGFFGLSAIIALAVGVGLIVTGVRRRPRRIRRRCLITTGALSGVVLLAVVVAGAAAGSAWTDLASGSDLVDEAADAVGRGEYDVAAGLLDGAADAFTRVDGRVGGPAVAPGRLVPGLAQNLRAASDLVAGTSASLRDAAAGLRDVDPDALALRDGKLDLAAVSEAGVALVRVRDAMDELRRVVVDAQDPWLLAPVDHQITAVRDDIDRNRARIDLAIDAARLVPRMLGADGPRRYLVLFASPSEARGLGGFVGNFAEVTAEDGAITVDRFDRRSVLESALAGRTVRCAGCPQELLDRYGRFGFTSGPGGGVGERVWSNLTMPAHFPDVAEAAADLYPRSGGRPVDGVLVMDPYVLGALMRYTGPISVPELDARLEPDDAASFVLRDQYLLAVDAAGRVDDAQRIDALAALGPRVITSLLSGSLPPPARLADALGPLVAERRLLAWTRDAEQQALLDRIGLLGALPALGDDGGFSVSVSNASGSKIELFLERDVHVQVVDSPDGWRLVADVELTNGAPAEGLPDTLIGNEVGLPPGSSRWFVTFYGPPELVGATLDGEPLALEPSREAGWSAYGHFVTLGPGETASYRLEFAPPGLDADSVPVTFEQPLATR